MKIHHALLLLAAGLLAGWLIPVAQPSSAAIPVLPGNAKAPGVHSLRMPEPVRREVRAIRSIKDRNARMQAVARLAAVLPVADLKQWYEGNYLGFLDEDTATLFRRIVEERWMEADPADIARFMMDRKVYRSERYIEAWLKADPAAAKAYLYTRKGEQRSELIGDYAEIMAKTDVPGALEFLSSLKGVDRFVIYSALDDLAEQDRDAVLAHVDRWPAEERSRARKQIAAAYLNSDFPWALSLLQQEGETVESFVSTIYGTMPNFPAGSSPVGRFAGLPEAWANKIAELRPSALTNNCPADWLDLHEAPSWLSPEAFQKFQLAAAEEANWEMQQRPGDARRLVEQGEWLPSEVRAKLAANVLKNWKDGVEQAEVWAATLDEDLRSETDKALDLLRLSSRSWEKEWLVRSSPTLYLGALLDPAPSFNLRGAAESWDKGEIAEAISASNNLSKEDCKKLLGARATLPPELCAHLLQRAGDALTPAESATRYTGIAGQWADEDVSAAAKWVESLPEGEARSWAAKNVVLRWSSYSPAAAKAWEAKMAAKP